METPMTLTVDNVVLSAAVPLGATLRQFLAAAGYSPTGKPLTEGSRALGLDLELAHRLSGANLSTAVPASMLAETPALVANQLLILVEQG